MLRRNRRFQPSFDALGLRLAPSDMGGSGGSDANAEAACEKATAEEDTAAPSSGLTDMDQMLIGSIDWVPVSEQEHLDEMITDAIMANVTWTDH